MKYIEEVDLNLKKNKAIARVEAKLMMISKFKLMGSNLK